MDNWKSLPLLDQDLVEYLRKKYPPLNYKDGADIKKFVNKAIYRSGQRDVADTIEHIIKLQRKEK